MPLNVLVAPSGFKEGIDASEVAAAIAAGVKRALPGAHVARLPLMDGGEGFTTAMVNTTAGRLIRVSTSDPLGRQIEACIGLLGGTSHTTAVIEIAAAAGLRLMAPNERDIGRASSAGVGHLIRHALDTGARRILIGCGDSGVNDGGAGLARALGARFLDAGGRDLDDGALALLDLSAIDLSRLDPRLDETKIEVAVNWKNALLGPRGVSRVYGPQKGASPELIERLEQALQILATHITATTSRDAAAQPGAGASGGIGAALHGLCRASLIPRFEVILRHLPFEAHLDKADLVITAEGMIDGQSARGKIPGEVAQRARSKGIPVIALAGGIGEGAEATLEKGVSAYFSITPSPVTLKQSMTHAAQYLSDTAEQAVRTFSAGLAARDTPYRQVPANRMAAST